MLDALIFGLISASSLALGALVALKFKLPTKLLGLIMAFGVGALISSVSFELIDDAYNSVKDIFIVVAGIFAGAITYFVANWIVDKIGSKNPKKTNDKSGMPILIGTVLDGIPESLVIGLGLAGGGAVSVAMIVAVFISNIPEAISSSVGLLKSGWKKWSVLGLWTTVIIVSALVSLAGFTLFGDTSPKLRAFVMAFASGAVLTMLADSMMPTAYSDSGRWTGLATALGFSVAFTISVSD